MATWPATLPDYVLIDGYSETLPENTIRTQMDVGPPKMRRRSTAAPRPINARLYMRKSQVATFDTFYETTLASGSLRFDWTHPRTGTAVEFRFTAAPQYEALGGTAYQVNFSLEVMP